MQNTTLRIFIFIETNFRSEDFNHALEHRFFENPAILALEDDSHTSISAYAHVTGILFKITTVRHSEDRVMKTFDAAFNGDIPNFSEKERKRFEQELKEREFDKEDDLVESCPFRQEFETDIPQRIQRFSDVIVRQSVCVWKNGTTSYSQKRFVPSTAVRALPHSTTSCQGEEFHLVTCHRVENATDSAYQTIWAEYVRKHLKEKYSRNWETYDIWTSAYNEAWFAYSGFYWYVGTETDFSFSAKGITIDSENFDHMKNVVAFDTKVGHEDVSFAQNVILGIDPQDELVALDEVTLEGFLEYLGKSEIAVKTYSK